MRKYLAFFKANIENTLTYRGPIIIWLVGNLLSLMVMVAVWLAAEKEGNIADYTKNELITYYIVALFCSGRSVGTHFIWLRTRSKTVG